MDQEFEAREGSAGLFDEEFYRIFADCDPPLVPAWVRFGALSPDRITPISELVETNELVNAKGKVVLSSGVHPWNNYESPGVRLYFDLADRTGMVRVFAWAEAAVKAGKLIERSCFIELKNAVATKRKPEYNNLNHALELLLFDDVFEIIRLPDNYMEVVEETPKFVPFAFVGSFKTNEYFSVKGKISEIREPRSGVGRDRGNSWTGQEIILKDENGNRLLVLSWNEYIPFSALTANTIGKTLAIIRGKYSQEWRDINTTGAQIILDGNRIK